MEGELPDWRLFFVFHVKHLGKIRELFCLSQMGVL